MFVSSGLVGPKSRSKGVDEGHQVNIPELRLSRYHLRGDASSKRILPLDVQVISFLGLRQANPFESNLESLIRFPGNRREVFRPWCQENPRRKLQFKPYRKPTQVGGENILRRASELSLRN